MDLNVKVKMHRWTYMFGLNAQMDLNVKVKMH